MDKRTRNENAKAFVERWSGCGYEKGETATFWTDLLREVIGMESVSTKCQFERRVSSGGFIDVLIPDSRTLIEQKSIGINLDTPETRQGKEVTPYQQGLNYAESMPLSQQPRFIVVCNFKTFRIHDRDKENPETDYVTFDLENLVKEYHYLDFLVDPAYSRGEHEKKVSIKAGELIGELYSALIKQYIDPESEESQHALNVLCVRLVFCLYAEDSDLFGKDAVLNYLKAYNTQQTRQALIRLFEVLNTPVDERDPYLSDELKAFPYVNGGLFAGDVVIPNFTDEIRFLLLLHVSQETDWSEISPTVFGGVFESTLNPETRHAGGMHYTSPENIHKVIGPLFLDDLTMELESIIAAEGITNKKRKSQLLAFQDKISSLTFFDPACGSGNFLTETYICLRRLENDVLAALNGGQAQMGFEGSSDIKVNINQFYGIEINDFAVRVAKTALWIAELQANNESEAIIQRDIEDLPLHDNANIIEGNALRIEWKDVVSPERCDYIMGNPPFLGSSLNTSEQKQEIVDLYGKIKMSNSIDYVGGWYYKASEYIQHTKINCAFVSTNSICQGEIVAPIWGTLFSKFDIRINFAWRTFIWNSEATGQAHVHCVIVGFSTQEGYSKEKEIINSDGKANIAKNISPYLVDAPTVILESRGKPLSASLPMSCGSKASDGGFLNFTEEQKNELINLEPASEKYIRKYIGSREFIRRTYRWCLWIDDQDIAELRNCPRVRNRLNLVKEFREKSSAKGTRDKANTPWKFFSRTQPLTDYLIIPRVSSQRRIYVPIGFMTPDVISSDSVAIVPDATVYDFGILSSQMHNAWMRTVAGRLKSDYRYSGNIVYNNFIWPNCSSSLKNLVSLSAKKVLEVRDTYLDSSFADMYDPDNEFLYPDLFKAHRELDRAVEKAYGVDFNGDEEKIVAHLFKLYAEATKDKL